MNKKDYSNKKYKIKYFLDQLPRAERIEAVKMLPKLLGIPQPTFRDLVYAEIGSGAKLSAENAVQLAGYFKTSTKDLLNEPVAKISKSTIRQGKNDVAKELGLVN